ncbi:MAG: hypothetical protein Q8N32_09405 [Sulfuricurvum sp.]|nr:hypothetical protein [Sulfuricurvum sp.]
MAKIQVINGERVVDLVKLEAEGGVIMVDDEKACCIEFLFTILHHTRAKHIRKDYFPEHDEGKELFKNLVDKKIENLHLSTVAFYQRNTFDVILAKPLLRYILVKIDDLHELLNNPSHNNYALIKSYFYDIQILELEVIGVFDDYYTKSHYERKNHFMVNYY